MARVLGLSLLLCSVSPARGQLPDRGGAGVTGGLRAQAAVAAELEAAAAPPAARALPAAAGEKALRGPVDESVYIVGPGDGFAVTVWAQAARSIAATVSPEGDLVLAGVATVPVAGKTLAEAKTAVRAEIARRYRNVEVSVSLVGLRSIQVNVVGNVIRPGIYVGTALDPASRMIEMAGGTGPQAGRRNISIQRRNGSSARVDLVQYERTGDLAANPPILDGDVIVVSWQKEKVVVDGAVEVADTYELVEGDTLGRLIEISGGLQRAARRDTVELRRFTDGQSTEQILVSLDDPAGRGMVLHDGDQVYVRSNVDFRVVETVMVEGEVRFPGPYGINEGTDRLADVIRRAGGFTALASVEEGQLVRTRGVDPIDREYERLTQIPVQDMSEKEYAYFKSKARERKGLVVVDFAKLAAGDEGENRLLAGGDRVFIPRKRATITVSGSVTFPGLITYEPERRPSHYVNLAGGYASNADRNGGRVLRGTTGEWEPLSQVDRVQPGDEIWIPEKSDRDWWVLSRETVAFIAAVATVYLVIDQATQ